MAKMENYSRDVGLCISNVNSRKIRQYAIVYH